MHDKRHPAIEPHRSRLLALDAQMTIRPATASDQATIRRLIYRAGLNPMPFDWRAFVVAQEADHIVGATQIKLRRDGARELASMVVLAQRRGQGIAQAMGRTLLAAQSDPVYLTCRQPLQAFYRRLGFRPATQSEVPPNFWRAYQMSGCLARLVGIQLCVMVYQPGR
jgi:N-acetylglutamate synthase-like GNAT family acetyltransferase